MVFSGETPPTQDPSFEVISIDPENTQLRAQIEARLHECEERLASLIDPENASKAVVIHGDTLADMYEKVMLQMLLQENQLDANAVESRIGAMGNYNPDTFAQVVEKIRGYTETQVEGENSEKI